MKLFKWFVGSNSNEITSAFEQGRAYGNQEGFHTGMSFKFLHTSELTLDEYNDVIQFLVSRKIEACYDVRKGGFSFRKRRYDI